MAKEQIHTTQRSIVFYSGCPPPPPPKKKKKTEKKKKKKNKVIFPAIPKIYNSCLHFATLVFTEKGKHTCHFEEQPSLKQHQQKEHI